MKEIRKKALSSYKQKKQQVYDKFNGKCAYTGKPLQEDWQIDHVESQFEWDYNKKQGDVHHIDNLFPTLRIINHYKRSKNIEQFKEYMLTFHLRLAKLPKKTSLESTKKRIEYMNSIADAFDITVDKPFDGKFYFEKEKENKNECVKWFNLFKEIVVRESTFALSAKGLENQLIAVCDDIINKCNEKANTTNI